jgi:hypothetical protein
MIPISIPSLTMLCDCQVCQALRILPADPAPNEVSAYVDRLPEDARQLFIAQFHVRRGTATDAHVELVQAAAVTCAAISLD